MTRLFALLIAVALAGCISQPKVPPGSTEYRATPYISTVTVTGNDVPGPLRVREVDAWLAAGDQTISVAPNAPLAATFSAWINGHGQFVGHWELDGEVVDRVSVFITYGETLRITLSGAPGLPTRAEGPHRIRFVVTKPVTELQSPELVYEVVL